MNKIKNNLIKKAENIPAVHRTLTDKHFRAVVSAACSTVINLAYTIYNGFLGVRYNSVWFITMFVYYAVLFAMRCGVVMRAKNKDRSKDYLIMRADGILLLILTLALTGIILLSMKYHLMKTHDQIVMIMLVTYTFYKVITAIINFVKGKKFTSPIIHTIRDINFADALVSLISTQMSMYATFGSAEEGRTMFIVTGAVVCAFIAALSVAMIISSVKEKWRYY